MNGFEESRGEAAFPLPANLLASASLYPVPDRRQWIAALPDLVRELAERWGLRLGQPYQPGGQCAWVAPVRDAHGRDFVLKVGWRHYEAAHEADGLRVWDGNGAVFVYDAEAFDSTSALLLERCVPGTALHDVVSEQEQDVVVAQLLRRLWCEPPEGHPFRPLQAMCDAWADEFEEKLQRAPVRPDPGLAREGMALFRTLPSTATRSVLLCTDLHGENILAAQREPWLVIDPKPYVGDPAYDPLQHMFNCPERLAHDPAAFTRRMAELVDVDPDRLKLWLFARCVQESIDRPELARVATRLAP